MRNLESLKRELVEFTPERFNNVYCNLIDIAQTSDREYEVLNALSFIADCNLMLKQVNETLENLQDETLEKQSAETHCPLCEEKEKVIQALKDIIQSKDRRINTLEELKTEYKKELDSLKGRNLKVCSKSEN